MGELPSLVFERLKFRGVPYLVNDVRYTRMTQVWIGILLVLPQLLLLMRTISFQRSWWQSHFPRMMAVEFFIKWLILDGIAAKELQLILQMSNLFVLLLQGLGLKNGLSLLLGEIVVTNLCNLM